MVKADAPKSFLFSMRGEAEVAKLQVGDLTATKLPVIVFDHPALKVLGEVLGRPIDGIIGFTFFARYKTTIDYQVNEMTFEPVDFQIRDLLRELPDRLAGPKTARRRVLAPPAGSGGCGWASPTGGIESPGVPVAEVLPGSPAARAGLKAGRRADDARRPLDDLGRRRLRRRRRRPARPGRPRRHPPRRQGADPHGPAGGRD